MQDQPTQRDVAAELDEAERAVLHMLLDSEVPGPWSVHEIEVEMGSRVRAADAIAGLRRAGLVHRCEEFVFATRPAARCVQLSEVF
jgi:hypothetical protein